MSMRFKVAVIEINGRRLNLAEGSTFNYGGVERETTVGDSSIGYTEKPKMAEIKANIFIEKGLSVAEINGWSNVDVVFSLDTGHVYACAGSWVTTIGELKNDGVVEVTFNAPASEEVTTGL